MDQFLTLAQYIENPMGKGSSIIPNSNQLKKDYLFTMMQNRNRMTIRWYQYKKESLICLITIPAHVGKDNTSKVHYDVIFEFMTSTEERIDQRPVRVFSNCPSFVFTYANVFWKKDFMCNWAKNKLGKDVFKESPEIRNSLHLIGYEKSLYLAAVYLMSFHLYRNVTDIERVARKMTSRSTILNQIQSDSEVLNKLNIERKEKEKAKEPPVQKPHESKPVHNYDPDSGVGLVKKVSKVSKITASSTISKVKRIKKK